MKHYKHAIEQYIIGYGMAKFAGDSLGHNEFVSALGYESRLAFLEELVDLKVVDTVNVMKNIQDSFDPLFNNAKQGYDKEPQRLLQYQSIREKIDLKLGKYGKLELARFVKLELKYIQEPNLLCIAERHEVEEVLHSYDGDELISTRLKKAIEPGIVKRIHEMCDHISICDLKDAALELQKYVDKYNEK